MIRPRGDQEFTVAVATRNGARRNSNDGPGPLLQKIHDLPANSLVSRGIGDDATLAHRFPAGLELRLDQGHKMGARRRQGQRRRQGEFQ